MEGTGSAGSPRAASFDQLTTGAADAAPVAELQIGAAVTATVAEFDGLTATEGAAPSPIATLDTPAASNPAPTAALEDVSRTPIDTAVPTGITELAEPASARERRPRAARTNKSAAWGRNQRQPEASPSEDDADPQAAAREICLRLLANRAHTRQELAQELRRNAIPEDVADAVLERFGDVGLIDDAAFAEQWVRSRHAVRGLGRRALAAELRRKGIDNDVAGEALGEVDDESEQRRARELVDRKLRSLRYDTQEQRATAGRRLVGMLARKGYGGGIAYRVVREALAAHGAELDELAAAELAADN